MATSTSTASAPAGPPGPFRARWFDAHSPVGRDAEVRLGDAGLSVSSAAGSGVWPLEQVVQTRGERRGEPIQLERRDAAEALVLDDPRLIAALRARYPEHARRFRMPSERRFARRIVLLLGALGLGAWAIYAFGIPAVAVAMARAVPVEWEERIGREMVERMAAPSGAVRDPRIVAPIDSLLRRLEAGAGGSPYTLRVVVLDRPEVNAFAAPGGWIGVHTGLLAFVETPDELAGVLAHEMEHVRRRHVTIALARRFSLSAVVALLGGDGSFALEAARSLGELSYGREAELEADEGGLATLVAAGGDGAAFARLLERMESAAGRPELLEFLSTHPGGKARAARLRLGHAASSSAGPLLAPSSWAALREVILHRASAPGPR